jgi:hypothetical protein
MQHYGAASGARLTATGCRFAKNILTNSTESAFGGGAMVESTISRDLKESTDYAAYFIDCDFLDNLLSSAGFTSGAGLWVYRSYDVAGDAVISRNGLVIVKRSNFIGDWPVVLLRTCTTRSLGLTAASLATPQTSALVSAIVSSAAIRLSLTRTRWQVL